MRAVEAPTTGAIAFTTTACATAGGWSRPAAAGACVPVHNIGILERPANEVKILRRSINRRLCTLGIGMDLICVILLGSAR
jgi:hypothetical protein